MPITQGNPNYELIRSLLQSAVINGRRLDRVEIQNNLPILDSIIFTLPNGNTVTINTTNDESFSVIIDSHDPAPDYTLQRFSGMLATDMLQQLQKEFTSVEFRKAARGANPNILYRVPALQTRHVASTRAPSSSIRYSANFEEAASASAIAFDRNRTNTLTDRIRVDAWKKEIAAREDFLGDSRYNDEDVVREIGLLSLLDPTNPSTAEVIELINQTAVKLKRLSQNINNSKHTKSIDILLKMMNEVNLKNGTQVNIDDFNTRITALYSNTIFIELLDSVREGLEMRNSGERNDDRILDRIVTNLFNSHPHFVARIQENSFAAARNAFLAANALMQTERLQMEEERRLRKQEHPRQRHVSFSDQITHQEKHREALAVAAASKWQYEDDDSELDAIFHHAHSEPIIAHRNPTTPVTSGAAASAGIEEETRATASANANQIATASAENPHAKKSRGTSHWVQTQLSALSLGFRRKSISYKELDDASPSPSNVAKPESPTAEKNEKEKEEKKK